jgi:hypothetical protein
MALNLTQIISQILSPQVVARLASALGINPALAQTLVSAAIPTVLAALGGVAATPAGAQRLSDQVGAQDPDILDKLVAGIGGGNQAGLLSTGAQALAGLIGGGSAVSALTGVLSKFTGAEPAAASSILGLVTPAALGAVASKDPENWTSGSAIASLFASEKGAIEAAMPPGLAAALGSTGLVPGLQSMASRAQGAATAATASATAAARTAASDAGRAAEQASSGMGWLPWAIAVAAIVLLGWWFFGNRATDMVERAKLEQSQAVQSGALKIGSLDVGAAVQGTIGALKQNLQGITDASSATAALPKLQDAASQFDKITTLVNQLPPAGKSALAAMIAAARPELDQLFSKVLAIPGVADVVKPTIDAIRLKLDTLAKAAG